MSNDKPAPPANVTMVDLTVLAKLAASVHELVDAATVLVQGLILFLAAVAIPVVVLVWRAAF